VQGCRRLHQEFRHIVRIMGTDVDGSLKTPFGIRKIRGVGVSLGNAITRAAGIDPDRRVGLLSDQEIQRLEGVIRDPAAAGIPGWMVNRQRDPATGKDLNLTGSDLALAMKQDVEEQIKLKSWRGVRHGLGLKVRGQRTRTTARKSAAVGVSKKQILAAKRKEEE